MSQIWDDPFCSWVHKSPLQNVLSFTNQQIKKAKKLQKQLKLQVPTYIFIVSTSNLCAYFHLSSSQEFKNNDTYTDIVLIS